MENLFRPLLGLYFVITSLAYVPAGFAYLGVGNNFGPWWLLPLVPLSEGVIFAAAGLMLLRTRSPEDVPLGPGVVFPPVESLLQLTGVYFIVTGLGSLVRPAIDMLFMTESWVARLGNFAAAAVWLIGGWVLVKRPRGVLEVLSRQAHSGR